MNVQDPKGIEVRTVRALKDNYCYLVHRAGSALCLVIDTSEFAPIQDELERAGLRLGLILNTHHHGDHVDANEDLVRRWDAPVYCSSHDRSRIPNAVRGLDDGETFEFDGMEIRVLAIPGHTRGQIAYYFPQAALLFVGDTLFSMGCGRLFEGTHEEMCHSLEKISSLPPQTQVFFGHEYTEKNGAFALNVEPDNICIHARLRAARESMSADRPTAAPTLAEEMRVNPFLRLKSPSIRRQLGLEGARDIEVFASLRRLRDVFQG